MEAGGFIDRSIGADVSYHAISWQKGSNRPSSIKTGGNIHYHVLPLAGTVEQSKDFAQVLFVLSGALRHRVNGETQELSANSVVFLRPDDFHSLLPPETESSCEIIILAFELEMLLSLSKYLENDAFLHLYTEPPVPRTFLMDQSKLNELSVRLLSVNSDCYGSEISKIKIKVALAELFSQFFLEQKLSDEYQPEWLRKLCALMRREENFKAGLTRLYALSGYTPEYLCKAFRRYLDSSPTEFINELRINYAARKLADSEIGIGELAWELNFKSLSRFYHLFHHYYQMSPAKYRARSRIFGKGCLGNG